jgi:SAM-dependent methyltransferase
MTGEEPRAELTDEAGRLGDQWERNAGEDPFWVILADPARTDRRWTEADFFATGETEWRRVAALLESVDAMPDPGGSFVDFGCGAGRMTRQFGRLFRTGVGIDVSDEMVAMARRLNPGLKFTVNRNPDLRFIPDGSVAFIYSHMVLQHITPSLQDTFVREFLRVLKPSGIAAFQVASENRESRRPAWRRAAARLPRPIKAGLKRLALRSTSGTAIEMEMHAMADQRVTGIVRAGGGVIVASPYTNSTDLDHNGAIRFFDRESALRRIEEESQATSWLSRFYVVRRR